MQKKYNRILFTYVDAAYNLQFYIVTFKNWFIVFIREDQVFSSIQFYSQTIDYYLHSSFLM